MILSPIRYTGHNGSGVAAAEKSIFLVWKYLPFDAGDDFLTEQINWWVPRCQTNQGIDVSATPVQLDLIAQYQQRARDPVSASADSHPTILHLKRFDAIRCCAEAGFVRYCWIPLLLVRIVLIAMFTRLGIIGRNSWKSGGGLWIAHSRPWSMFT